MLAQRSARETLEAADSDVILNLTIPYRCVVLHEPAPESRQFPLGKAFDCRANLVNTAHEIRVYLPLGYSGGAERHDVLQIDDGAPRLGANASISSHLAFRRPSTGVHCDVLKSACVMETFWTRQCGPAALAVGGWTALQMLHRPPKSAPCDVGNHYAVYEVVSSGTPFLDLY